MALYTSVLVVTFNRTSLELKPFRTDGNHHAVGDATFNRTSLELKLTLTRESRRQLLTFELLIEPVWN